MTAAKGGSKVVIDVNGGGIGTVFVDDAEVKGVRSVATVVNAGEPPSVVLSLAVPFNTQIKYEGATISIADVVMPVAVELALWRHLSEKYGRVLDVSTLSSVAREKALCDGPHPDPRYAFSEGALGDSFVPWKPRSESDAQPSSQSAITAPRFDFCKEAESRLRAAADEIRRESADATVCLTSQAAANFEQVTISVRRSLL